MALRIVKTTGAHEGERTPSRDALRDVNSIHTTGNLRESTTFLPQSLFIDKKQTAPTTRCREAACMERQKAGDDKTPMTGRMRPSAAVESLDPWDRQTGKASPTERASVRYHQICTTIEPVLSRKSFCPAKEKSAAQRQMTQTPSRVQSDLNSAPLRSARAPSSSSRVGCEASAPRPRRTRIPRRAIRFRP